MQMIHFYDGATLLASYDTVGIAESNFLEAPTRGNLYQPPGSQQAIVEGDMVDAVEEFDIAFRINVPLNNARTNFDIIQLRRRCGAATSLYFEPWGLWRALIGGRENVKNFSPRPESSTDMDAAIVQVTFRPKFGRWTVRQAETVTDYLDIYEDLPYEIGQEPWTDGTLWSDGGGWQN